MRHGGNRPDTTHYTGTQRLMHMVSGPGWTRDARLRSTWQLWQGYRASPEVLYEGSISNKSPLHLRFSIHRTVLLKICSKDEQVLAPGLRVLMNATELERNSENPNISRSNYLSFVQRIRSRVETHSGYHATMPPKPMLDIRKIHATCTPVFEASRPAGGTRSAVRFA